MLQAVRPRAVLQGATRKRERPSHQHCIGRRSAGSLLAHCSLRHRCLVLLLAGWHAACALLLPAVQRLSLRLPRLQYRKPCCNPAVGCQQYLLQRRLALLLACWLTARILLIPAP